MLTVEFGGPNHAIYLDYLFTLISISFDVNFENEDVNNILDQHMTLTKTINKISQPSLKTQILGTNLNTEPVSEFVLESMLIKIQIILNSNQADI